MYDSRLKKILCFGILYHPSYDFKFFSTFNLNPQFNIYFDTLNIVKLLRFEVIYSFAKNFSKYLNGKLFEIQNINLIFLYKLKNIKKL